MAQCRCRDTLTKRCRWEFSTPDPFRSATAAPGKQARKDQRDPKKAKA